MWKSFCLENDIFLLKFVIGPMYKFYLTDLQNIWMEELSEKDVLHRFEALNPLCVDANIVEELTGLIQNASSDTIILTRCDTNIKIEISMSIDNFSLRYFWKLSLQPKDTLFKIFTLNLINTIQYLELEQKRLQNLLEKKEKEIDEYKREHGEISRVSLKTEKFIRNNIDDGDSSDLLLNTLTNKDIFPHLMSKYGIDVIKRKSKSLEKTEVSKKKLKPYKGRNAK